MVVYRKTSIEKITLELSDVSMLLSHCQWKKMTVLSWFEYKLVEKYYIIDICLRSHVHSFARIVRYKRYRLTNRETNKYTGHVALSENKL